MSRFLIFCCLAVLLFGCSSLRRTQPNPADTIINIDNSDDPFYVQKSLKAIGFDSLSTAYNYSKADIVASIFFDFDRDYIKNEGISKIEKASSFFLKNESLKVLVVGHCDHFGSITYNDTLGRRRAENTKAKLVEFGVDEDRIITASVGSMQATEKSRDKTVTVIDRRSDIVLLKKEVE